MLRYLVCFFVLLLLPSGIYRLKSRLSAKPAQNAPQEKLLLAGLILAAAFLAVLAVYEGAPANATYTPARYENGRVIPAHFESASNAS